MAAASTNKSPSSSAGDGNSTTTSITVPPTKNDKKKRKKQRLKQWLREELLGEVVLIVVGSFAMIASSLSNSALPRLMGNLLDQKSSDSSSCSNKSLVAISPTLSLLAVVVGGGMASFLRTTMLNRAEGNISARLRTQVFRALMTDKDLEWFQTESVTVAASTTNTNTSTNDNKKESPAQANDKPKAVTADQAQSNTKQQQQQQRQSTSATTINTTGMTPGAIAMILNDDVTEVAHTMTATTANLIRSSFSGMFSTYNMLRLHPPLFITSVCTVPLIGMAAMTMRKFLKKVTAQRHDQALRAAKFAEERITHIAMVKMSHRQDDEVTTYQSMQDDCTAIGRKESLANGAFMGFTFSATSSALFMVVHLGGRAVAAKRMTSGQLTSFATYSFLLGLAASGMVKSLGEIFQSMVGAQRVYDMVHDEEKDDGGNSTDSESSLEKLAGTQQLSSLDIGSVDSISLRNISFGYKARPDVTALRNVSIELKRGTVVALCGKNGSGKSTTAALLAGLYQPQAGSIALLPDGIHYHELDRSLQKQLVQVVPQSAPLFNMSVLDNVRYSHPTASTATISAALKAANCDALVSKLPGGLDFVVGMHGCKLSAGQRQRLALARALVADPFLLVLDEAASALDAEGESAVSDAVVACRGDGRALLLITHRPKSLHVADVVVVLRDGEVVETGSLKELKANQNSELCQLMPDLAL